MSRAGRCKAAVRDPSRLLSTCRHCLRLSEAQACRECLDHKQMSGHFPRQVFRRQIPGQPRAVSRFCGKCGAEL